LVIEAVPSAMPSINPNVTVLAPSNETRNTGRSEWIISDDRSMHRLTKPRSQTTFGILRFFIFRAN
jgi:hypothetical protein